MDFPFGRTVYRLRAVGGPEPYNPEVIIPVDWARPRILALPGAFVAHTSTSMLSTATREQALEAKSLFDPTNGDVVKGDRIFEGTFNPPLSDGADLLPVGTSMSGLFYTIDGIPPAPDTNPWTGWTPPREIPLTRYVG